MSVPVPLMHICLPFHAKLADSRPDHGFVCMFEPGLPLHYCIFHWTFFILQWAWYAIAIFHFAVGVIYHDHSHFAMGVIYCGHFHFAIGMIYSGHFSFRNGRDILQPFFLQWAWFTMAIFHYAMGLIYRSQFFFSQWAWYTMIIFHFAMGMIYCGHFSFCNGRDLPKPFFVLQWAWYTVAIFHFAIITTQWAWLPWPFLISQWAWFT
jgi:hypothetical protein